MAVERQGNWLGSMRVDVPHLRLLESSVVGDFQALSGTLMAGSRALVASGARILDTGVVGTSASSLLLRMASAVFLHATAAEPGTIFTVSPVQPDDILNGTNANVVGSFTPGASQVNYVSVDLIRTADPTTEDAVVFRSSSTGSEFTQVVPLGRVLHYRIHISTSDFGTTPSHCPLAKVTVDPSGNVVSIVDARQMFWRLGTGGTTPNALAQFTWANRNEATSTSGFTGGDKDLASQYDFNRAIMQRMWELGGGEHWYAPADDRTVQLTYDNTVVFPATGENWQWTGTDLLWRGLSYWFANSTATENLVADVTVATPGLTDLTDGQLIYVELNRTSNVTINAVKANWSALFTLPPATPGSRHILAWRQHGRVFVGQQSVVVNTGGVHATNTSFGTVKLFTAYAPDPANPIVPVVDAGGQVVARGITRDVAGALTLGTGANDASVSVSKSGAVTTVFGSLTVNQTATINATAGVALTATGAGTNYGVFGTGGPGGADGVHGEGTGTQVGVSGTGGPTNGWGVLGTGGGTDGIGVRGVGLGTGDGVNAQGGNHATLQAGDGVQGTGGNATGTNTGGHGGRFVGGNSSGGAGAAGVQSTGGTGVSAAQGGVGVSGTGVGSASGVVGTGGATTGTGVRGQGGATDGIGVSGTGGATNGAGVVGQGTGTGRGVEGTGGSGGASGVFGLGGAAGSPGVAGTGVGSGAGVTGQGGATAGAGVSGTGGATSGTGVSGTGGTTNGAGVTGQGTGAGPGVSGTGGASNGTGVVGVGGATNGTGVTGTGAGTGAGVSGTGGATAPGVDAVAGNTVRGPLHLGVLTADPSSPVDGDIWIRNDTGTLNWRANGSTHTVGP